MLLSGFGRLFQASALLNHPHPLIPNSLTLGVLKHYRSITTRALIVLLARRSSIPNVCTRPSQPREHDQPLCRSAGLPAGSLRWRTRKWPDGMLPVFSSLLLRARSRYRERVLPSTKRSGRSEHDVAPWCGRKQGTEVVGPKIINIVEDDKPGFIDKHSTP